MGTVISGKVKIYNVLADMCSYIVRTQAKNYLVRYSCISTEEKSRVEDIIQSRTPLQLNMEGRFMPILESDIDDTFIDSLVLLAQNLMDSDDKNCIMRLIIALDSCLSWILQDEINLLQQKNTTHELNTNRNETGIELLPRCTCVWARKSRQSFSYRRLDNYLTNLMVIEDDNTTENIVDEHIFIPKGFFKRFDATGMLKVAASPLSCRPNFDIRFHKSKDLQVFSLDYHLDEVDKFNQLIWDKILEAGKNEAEIVVFPEMLGNAETESYIIDRIKELSAGEQEELPAMICLPTFFGEHINVCSILDRHGHIMAHQHKQNPYVMNCDHGEYMEDILGFGLISVFHYEGIGRFSILICKDFLTTRYMERIMRGFMLTMLIIPAYSTGAYDFKMSFDLCAHDYCNVVWINSCAAMIPGKENNFAYIGYTRKRINRYQNESEAHHKMIPCDKLLTGKCNKDCLYYDSFGTV